jgi:hypothetical protein
MEFHQVLANMYTQSQLHGVARSALPNAPTLPVAERTSRVSRIVALARRAMRHLGQRTQPAQRLPHRKPVAS